MKHDVIGEASVIARRHGRAATTAPAMVVPAARTLGGQAPATQAGQFGAASGSQCGDSASFTAALCHSAELTAAGRKLVRGPHWAHGSLPHPGLLQQQHGQHAALRGGRCGVAATAASAHDPAGHQQRQQRRQLTSDQRPARAACSRGSLPVRLGRRLEKCTQKTHAASSGEAPRLDRASASFMRWVAMSVPSCPTAPLQRQDGAIGNAAAGALSSGADIVRRVSEMHLAAGLAKLGRKADTVCR